MSTANYGWMITTDNISEGDEKSRRGLMGPSNISQEIKYLLIKGVGLPFRMLDGDRDVNYKGIIVATDIKDCGFQPLDDFGTPDSGCTTIQYKVKGRWTDL